MTEFLISKKEARDWILSSQLLNRKTVGSGVIEDLSYVQIDTISVIERAHHHVLWSRNPKYRPKHLDQWTRERKTFEYWSHAAAFLPMCEYRYTLPMKSKFRKRVAGWWPRDTRLMKKVLDRIRSEGPLQSRDFAGDKVKGGGWGDWKPAKKALERLFMEGQLEITQRQGFQKVYDLPERVIPNFKSLKTPSLKEYHQHLIHKTLRHHGLATPEEMAYLRRGEIKKAVRQEVESMVNQGELEVIKVEGLNTKYFALTGEAEKKRKTSRQTHILSPFDNLIIQRKKLQDFFDFDYQIECYVPEKKRKFGYFVLPILVGREFAGRVDCKADREKQQLVVRSLYWEDVKNKSKFGDRISAKLSDFAEFNGCNDFRFQRRKDRI